MGICGSSAKQPPADYVDVLVHGHLVEAVGEDYDSISNSSGGGSNRSLQTSARSMASHLRGNAAQRGSAPMFTRDMSEEEKQDLLEELKKERERVKQQQMLLINIRDALLEIQAENDSDDEASARAEAASRRRSKRMSKRMQRKLAKKTKFALPTATPPPRPPMAPNTTESRRNSTRQQLRGSIKRVKNQTKPRKANWSTFEGEGTRAWDNPFASRLTLMLKFYQWDDIPMDFFVDKWVSDIGAPASTVRPRLAARMAEKHKLNTRRVDNRQNIRQSLRRSMIQKGFGNGGLDLPPAAPKNQKRASARGRPQRKNRDQAKKQLEEERARKGKKTHVRTPPVVVKPSAIREPTTRKKNNKSSGGGSLIESDDDTDNLIADATEYSYDSDDSFEI